MSNPTNLEFSQKIHNTIIDELTHRCDGPVTKFVVICRAMKLAYDHKFHPSVIANALDDVLLDLVDNEWSDS